MEMEEERRARLENDVATYQTAQVARGDRRRKKSKTGEDGSYHTVQVGTGDRGRKKSKKRNGFDLDLIRVEIGVLKKTIFFKE